MRNAVILAAGKGTRMKSVMNKVMHPLIDRPVLAYVIEALQKAGVSRIVVITGYQAKSIQDAWPELEFALQEPQLGTGHAVMQAKMLESEKGQTLIINGDGPCIQPETLEKLFQENENASLTLLSSVLEDGAHYGRIIRGEDGSFQEIVEAKDCSDEQKKVREVNAGIYCFNNEDLFDGLKELTNDNAQNEYYLTDLVKILNSKGKKVQALPVEDPDEVQGINDVKELYQAYSWLKNRYIEQAMDQGVQIVDPVRTVIGKDAEFGHDVIVHPNTEIYGSTKVGDYAVIESSHLDNVEVGRGSKISHAWLKNCRTEDEETVQPMTVKEGH